MQSVVLDDLPAHLRGRAARIHIPVAPGDFVTLADPLAEVWADAGEGRLRRAVRSAVVIGSSRDVGQDPLYGVRQLADIATKAMSPSINDPSTAWTTIRYIQAICERVGARALPPEVRRAGALELVVHRTAFEDFLEVGFVQVSRYAHTDARVAGALLEGLAAVARAAHEAAAFERLPPILDAARAIAEPALGAARTDRDRDAINGRAERVAVAVAGCGSGEDAPEDAPAPEPEVTGS